MGKSAGMQVYLKCGRNAEVKTDDVYLKDIAELYCEDGDVANRLKALKIHRFHPDRTAQSRRCVYSTLRLAEMMTAQCPGISVEIVGESDVLIERVGREPKGWVQALKIVFVCLISFFGTAFTIMAYHNDIGITSVFEEIYRMCMGRKPEGINVLEVAYSVGLAVGIALFFNHVGGKRFTKDPSPIEVAMRNYEQDVDGALIEAASRKKLEQEVSE